jgi:hypothetical protein
MRETTDKKERIREKSYFICGLHKYALSSYSRIKEELVNMRGPAIVT